MVSAIIAVYAIKKFKSTPTQTPASTPPPTPPTTGTGGITYSSMKCGDYFYKEIMYAKESIGICSPWISLLYVEHLLQKAQDGKTC